MVFRGITTFDTCENYRILARAQRELGFEFRVPGFRVSSSVDGHYIASRPLQSSERGTRNPEPKALISVKTLCEITGYRRVSFFVAQRLNHVAVDRPSLLPQPHQILSTDGDDIGDIFGIIRAGRLYIKRHHPFVACILKNG